MPLAEGCGVSSISHSSPASRAIPAAEHRDVIGVIGEPVFIGAHRAQAVGVDDGDAGNILQLSTASSSHRWCALVAMPSVIARRRWPPVRRRQRRGSRRSRAPSIVQPCLRIARIVFPGADDVDRARADQHRRTARLLEPRHAADMIEMLMAAQKRLHIGYLEAKAGDIGGRRLPNPWPCRYRSAPIRHRPRSGSHCRRCQRTRCCRGSERAPRVYPTRPSFAGPGQKLCIALPACCAGAGFAGAGSPMQRNRQVPWRDRE